MRIAVAEGCSLGGNPEEKNPRNYKDGNAEETGDNLPIKRKSYGWQGLLKMFLQGSVQGDPSLQLHEIGSTKKKGVFFLFISKIINNRTD